MDGNLRLVTGAAVVGIFLGLAGLVFGIVSKHKADELRGDFSQVQGLFEKIQQVEESSTGISASATRIRRELDGLREGTQGALDQVSTELVRLRRDLNESIALARSLEQKLAEVRRQQPAPAPTPAVAPPAAVEATERPASISEATPPPVEAPPPPSEPEGEIYTIRGGDTLTAVAGRHAISLDKLIAANPGINPDRIQIGQQIRIPAR